MKQLTEMAAIEMPIAGEPSTFGCIRVAIAARTTNVSNPENRSRNIEATAFEWDPT